jgi:glutamate transport system permease protein
VDVVLDNLDVYWRGMRTTASLTLLSFAVAMLIGLVVAAFRVSPVPPLRAAGTAYVEVFRNIPLVVLFVLFFFGLPKIGVLYSPYYSAVIVLAVYTGSFLAETIRAGVNTVAKGQAEAARSIGLTFPQTLRIVILPQALRTVVQPMGNIFSALIRNTSVAYTISVIDLTGAADRLNTDTARPMQVFIGAAIAYLLMTLPAGYVIGLIEQRVAFKR